MSLVVTGRHLRAAGRLCAPGAAAWFKAHNLDFKEFLLRGLPIEQVEHIDDEFARSVIAAARAEQE